MGLLLQHKFKKLISNKQLSAEKLSFYVTEKCNLKCAMCDMGDAGPVTMTGDIVDATLEPFNDIKLLTILGGEPTLAPEVVEHIIKNLTDNKINVNELRVFTNGLENKQLKDLFEILMTRPENVKSIDVTVSMDSYHNNAISAIGRDPDEVAKNFLELGNIYGSGLLSKATICDDIGGIMTYGRARELRNRYVTEKRIHPLHCYNGELSKFGVSAKGFERADFVNPEDVVRDSYGHVINDGMLKILSHHTEISR